MQNGINLTGLGQRNWGLPDMAGKPKSAPEQAKPFSNPDVFRPAYPIGPDDFPNLPKILPPAPGPFIEVPYDIPMELPILPGAEEWTKIPVPEEIPDWSKMPLECPQPDGMIVKFPSKEPNFPHIKMPDGNWVLS